MTDKYTDEVVTAIDGMALEIRKAAEEVAESNKRIDDAITETLVDVIRHHSGEIQVLLNRVALAVHGLEKAIREHTERVAPLG